MPWISKYDISCNNIPECSNCKYDTELLKTTKKEIKLRCCEFCIWYKWFDNKRKIYAKKEGKELIYFIRKDISEKKTENGNIIVFNFNRYMKLKNID